MVLIPQEVLEMDFADLANITNEDNSQPKKFRELTVDEDFELWELFSKHSESFDVGEGADNDAWTINEAEWGVLLLTQAAKRVSKLPEFDFNNIDVDGTGRITFAEWEAFVLSTNDEETEEDMRQGAREYWDENIAPKLEGETTMTREIWESIREDVAAAATGIDEALEAVEELKEVVEEITEVAESIGA